MVWIKYISATVNRFMRVGDYTSDDRNTGPLPVQISDGAGGVINPAAPVLAASEAHIGQVGGMLASVSDEITRPADSTAYTANDVVNGASLAVTGATNATPIVVTTAAHGLTTGDRVTIASVGGNTAANGSWAVTVLSSTTFSLDTSVGNGAYTSGGVVWKGSKLANFARVAAGDGYITKARLTTDQKTNVARFRIHLYRQQPDPIADNSPFLLLYVDDSKYLGYIDLPACATEDATNSTGAQALATPNTSGSNLPLSFTLPASLRDIWIVRETRDAFTPASGQKITTRLTGDLN